MVPLRSFFGPSQQEPAQEEVLGEQPPKEEQRVGSGICGKKRPKGDESTPLLPSCCKRARKKKKKAEGAAQTDIRQFFRPVSTEPAAAEGVEELDRPFVP